ncbi:oxygen-independent coproporphyrinogen III oxidase [Methylobacterium sp. 4-46]|uniref:oxygen-independent coproporphyrinogen III oxidase n=1 Tax=unclassified Methylobacterium TaxID=2615210 RepID=UPI000152D401|nr:MULTISPECIES: oxygen-independent coproporphyrinogen III oxidase [Methylobacterium]ACA15497.1 oxygen-independent coproporphyrinogen III oxidase [Methylobacterium sp. 4-46]WFT81214.1 oxygen-independent coproporphyrinogen III oxidase [Methylobacterium nodulans]
MDAQDGTGCEGTPIELPHCRAKPDCARLEPVRAAALVARYGQPVPRYTSYPTAAQFTGATGPAEHAAWLAALPPAEPVSLYLHVPFCDQLCWYCGCHTSVVHRRGPIEDYVATLTREIGLVAEALPARLAAGAVHFGGGTPNLLAPGDLAAVVEALRRHFTLSPDTAFAAELDPRLLTEAWITTACGLGLNRASLGVQDLDPQVQAAINRRQPFSMVAWSVEHLRRAGVGSINLDLMYGLPHQTTKGLLSTIDQVAALRPERIALFGYAHVPWMKPAQRLIPDHALPGPVGRLEQQREAAARLQDLGYVRIGLDHFAWPDDALAEVAAAGRLRRNFQGYTEDAAETVIGFGASAISHLPAGYAQNHAGVPAWRERILAGDLPTARGLAVGAADRLRGAVIERLMCDFAVDLRRLCALHDTSVPALVSGTMRARLEEFARDGLVRLFASGTGPDSLDGIAVTETGRSFVRGVCAVFDRHLVPAPERHAAAV